MTAVDLEGPLKMFPRFHEFWVFADDAAHSVLKDQADTNAVVAAPVWLFPSGIAVVRRSGESHIDVARAYTLSVTAERLKGKHWDHAHTYGILVGEPPKVLVMAWGNGEWHAYGDGLTPWIKETLLAEVHRQHAPTQSGRRWRGHLDCDCQKMGVEIRCVVCGDVIPESHTMVFVADGTHKHMDCEGQAPMQLDKRPASANPLLKARKIIERILAQVAECRPKASVVGSVELTMLCGLASQALDIVENADRLVCADADLEAERERKFSELEALADRVVAAPGHDVTLDLQRQATALRVQMNETYEALYRLWHNDLDGMDVPGVLARARTLIADPSEAP